MIPLLLALFAAAAMAGSANVTADGEVRFKAGGEGSRITVNDELGHFVIADRRAKIKPRRRCAKVTPRKVTCPHGAEGRPLVARLGNGADDFRARAKTPVEVYGEGGNDFLSGGENSLLTALDGGRGDDKLRGGLKDDLLEGGLGNDVLRGGGGRHDDLWGGPGNDIIEFGEGGGSALGGTGDDHLTGGERDSILVGEEGDDTIDALGSPGRDLVNCGPGTDGAIMGSNDRFFVNADSSETVTAADAGCEDVRP